MYSCLSNFSLDAKIQNVSLKIMWGLIIFVIIKIPLVIFEKENLKSCWSSFECLCEINVSSLSDWSICCFWTHLSIFMRPCARQCVRVHAHVPSACACVWVFFAVVACVRKQRQTQSVSLSCRLLGWLMWTETLKRRLQRNCSPMKDKLDDWFCLLTDK